jgi:hypothetical protein
MEMSTANILSMRSTGSNALMQPGACRLSKRVSPWMPIPLVRGGPRRAVPSPWCQNLGRRATCAAAAWGPAAQKGIARGTARGTAQEKTAWGTAWGTAQKTRRAVGVPRL